MHIHSSSMISHKRALDHDFCREGGASHPALIPSPGGSGVKNGLGWQNRLNGHEFEQTPGGGERQGSLLCCSLWGCKEVDMTERPNNSNNNAGDLEDMGSISGSEGSLEKEMAPHSSILPGKSHGQRSLAGYRLELQRSRPA